MVTPTNLSHNTLSCLLLCIISLVLPFGSWAYVQRASHYNPQQYSGSGCGYESCHPTNPSSLNVHIVCHTHLDTGWVETYDEYYRHYVKQIYDSVVATLKESPNRKFIAVEVSFFSRWYNEQTDGIKQTVSMLVQRGQLEFIGGGWSMNDEAASHYQDVIDQLTHGHQWLNETFGSCAAPKIGWQIDPFGHSREFASILSQMGFDGMFLGRIDYQDKAQREATKTLEMIWKSSPSLGKKADLFTGVLPNVYWPPQGFCFDTNCWDEIIHEDNMEKKAKEFIDHVKKQASKYATNHTVITMGMDFYYRDAKKWFTNLDKLMDAINRLEGREGVRMIYSTPSCYLKSLHEQRKRWPTKLDDFFPYADAFNTYWSGYFTSRPSLKYHIRYGNNILQVVKQLQALVGAEPQAKRFISDLQGTMGILQHHDAVTGTCKQYVSNDYTFMLDKAINKAQQGVVDAYAKLWMKEGFAPTTSLTFCNHLNVSSCEVTQSLGPGNDLVIIIYNPVAHPVKHYVRLPVQGVTGYRVRDVFGVDSPSQIVPNPVSVSKLPGRTSLGPMDSELVFRVMLPPLGFTSIALDRPDTGPGTVPEPSNNYMSQVLEGDQYTSEVAISNGRFTVLFDPRSGLMTDVVMKDGRKIPMTQNFFIYESDGRKMGERPSGAYAFNPSANEPRMASTKPHIRVIKGPLVEEVHQTFSPWISQVVRVYQHVDYIEMDWVVGPIPLDNWFYDPGQEVVSRITSNLLTNGTFFTDSNSRETIRRVRHHRPTWDLDTTERTASNYYPVTGWLFCRDYDKDVQITMLPDRAQGGSSMQDGELELMVHRRLTMDDGFGMEEALNEPGLNGKGLIARGKHRLIVSDIQDSVRQMRMMSKSLNLKPLMTFRPRKLTGRSEDHMPRSLTHSKFIGLNRRLPPNINLLTLEQWTDDRVLIRLEHIFEVNEDPKYSRPRRIQLRNLFTPFVVVGMQEMTLDGTHDKESSDRKRLRWFPDLDPYANYTNVLTQVDSEDLEGGNGDNSGGDLFTITMFPMEIRTFLLTTIERKNCIYSGANVNRVRGRFRTPNC